ncbi:helix-turn-helix domain-containing protein [Mycolicibacterium litorale]|uniref:Transcriptional regulator n=1 Tax=Mycolicibacterium litorale TaxID=758802 RepID=A0AAD1MSQ1_9MYCO|nr:helix-turn-helix transcriptional regulator [Mycolicibacterium litorale]MCV7414370.1 helix-turn-helix domain-containing protein [Mycolicibacterium litorale]TDY01934.1 helix-turn-helix protein [Mycolicibacterium litorale]BBY15433.1 transcriptional regulator [Mycolicibacterium litorale]
MVRSPLTPQQIAAGKRLGAFLREARGDRKPAEVAQAASISPETLRKIETGRLATPAFTTVAALAAVLEIPLDELARICVPELNLQRTG